MPLEDELGDILQKARDGKMWSQQDLAKATDISENDIQQIENYQLIPENSIIEKLAKTLDLDGPALMDIAQERWIPEPPVSDPSLIWFV